MFNIFKSKVFRTLHVHGTVNGTTAATIKVDDKVVYSGPITNGILFNFVTNVKLHGKVKVGIKIWRGELTISNIRVTYPAVINGIRQGLINMPQPISEPLANINKQKIMLPLTVNTEIEYYHYMFNGPKQWLILVDQLESLIVIDNFIKMIESGKLHTDWQYRNKSTNINKLII